MPNGNGLVSDDSIISWREFMFAKIRRNLPNGIVVDDAELASLLSDGEIAIARRRNLYNYSEFVSHLWDDKLSEYAEIQLERKGVKALTSSNAVGRSRNFGDESPIDRLIGSIPFVIGIPRNLFVPFKKVD